MFHVERAPAHRRQDDGASAPPVWRAGLRRLLRDHQIRTRPTRTSQHRARGPAACSQSTGAQAPSATRRDHPDAKHPRSRHPPTLHLFGRAAGPHAVAPQGTAAPHDRWSALSERQTTAPATRHPDTAGGIPSRGAPTSARRRLRPRLPCPSRVHELLVCAVPRTRQRGRHPISSRAPEGRRETAPAAGSRGVLPRRQGRGPTPRGPPSTAPRAHAGVQRAPLATGPRAHAGVPRGQGRGPARVWPPGDRGACSLGVLSRREGLRARQGGGPVTGQRTPRDHRTSHQRREARAPPHLASERGRPRATAPRIGARTPARHGASAPVPKRLDASRRDRCFGSRSVGYAEIGGRKHRSLGDPPNSADGRRSARDGGRHGGATHDRAGPPRSHGGISRPVPILPSLHHETSSPRRPQRPSSGTTRGRSRPGPASRGLLQTCRAGQPAGFTTT